MPAGMLRMDCGATADSLRLGQADIGAGLEENFDDADTGQRLAFDVLDIIDRGAHDAGKGRDHASGNFRSLQAAELEHHAHHRNIDGGEDVDGHVERR